MGDYRQCVRCVLSTGDDPSISFDDSGLCNHCRTYDDSVSREMLSDREAKRELELILDDIRRSGNGKRYDCIIGLSGGVDSTYVAYKVKQMGLRPLAVHLDNGWDSELAVKNIESTVMGLGIDLYTHVIDWKEFRDLQLSYFRAGVIDLEIPSDHAIMAALYNTASKYGVRYILSGHNLVTEGFIPERWIHHKFDTLNLRSIHRRFGSIPLRTTPIISYPKFLLLTNFMGYRMFPLLNYMHYNKVAAKEEMARELNWRDYGAKHYESIFTRFYQGYILPEKFGVDKRKSHLSTLICSGQMTREEVLAELDRPPYPSASQLEEDRTYVIKKLGFTDDSFRAYMNSPEVLHSAYPSYISLYRKYLQPIVHGLRKLRGR